MFKEVTKLKLGIGLVSALAAILLLQASLLQSVEGLLYDIRARLVADRVDPSNEIVIIGIDETSLSKLEKRLGRFPWQRSVHGSVVEYCAQSKAIVFDILFPEGEWQEPEDDRILADVVAESGKVVIPFHFGLVTGEEPSLLAHTLSREHGHTLEPEDFDHPIPPYPALLDASASLGHAGYHADRDGVVRSYSLVSKIDGQLYPSLALSAWATAARIPVNRLRLEGKRLYLNTGTPIRLDAKGRMKFIQSKLNCRIYSVSDVLDSWVMITNGQTPKIPPDAFKDKIVLYGSLATSLQRDRKSTPVNAKTPGVIVHATAIENLLQGHQFKGVAGWFNLLTVFLMAMIPVLVPWQRPWHMYATAIAIMLAFALLSLMLAIHLHRMTATVSPLLALVLSCTLLGTMYWYQEWQQRKQLQAAELAKQQFTDMLVHDLKNVLVPVVLSVDMARTSEEYDPEFMATFVDTVESSSQKLLTQISNLLDIRRMREGKLPLNRQPVAALDFVQGLIGRFEKAAEMHDKKLALDYYPENARALSADLDVMARVLENLMSNALKYGARNEAITVSCRFNHEECRIGIANHGEPISPELQQTMFSAFVTGTPSEDQRIRSTGLGLAFCKLAVEAHGGRISLCSPCYEDREGVEVFVHLPVLKMPD